LLVGHLFAEDAQVHFPKWGPVPVAGRGSLRPRHYSARILPSRYRRSGMLAVARAARA
jgi:hypothetical protein